MRTTRGWTGLRPTVFALGFVAAAATTTAGGARAANIPTSPLMTFNTIGSGVGSANVSGAPVIDFMPVTGGSFLAPSNLSLGKFVVKAPTGGATTYADTPFSIKLAPTALDGQTIDPAVTPLTITGKLNGTVSNMYQSDVVATFDKLKASQFQAGQYLNDLKLPDAPLRLVPQGTNDGATTVQAFLSNSKVNSVPAGEEGGGKPTPNPVPEPATFALFAAAFAGLGARHRLRSRRAA